jgi:phenylpyruvate tautomerase PptA (4-oxalocrotonate tautomerase family)
MPWINLTVRRGTFTKEVQHAVMAKLTDALMFWEMIPDTPEARKKMKGWVYLVDEDSDYNGGTPHHKDPFYFIEVRLPVGRFDTLTKQHMINDFTKIIMLAEGKTHDAEDANRVWVTILEIQRDDWGIGGHTDWLRDYESALKTLGTDLKPRQFVYCPTEPIFTCEWDENNAAQPRVKFRGTYDKSTGIVRQESYEQIGSGRQSPIGVRRRWGNRYRHPERPKARQSDEPGDGRRLFARRQRNPE